LPKTSTGETGTRYCDISDQVFVVVMVVADEEVVLAARMTRAR